MRARFYASVRFTIRAVIIECTNCHSKYQYDESRFEARPSRRIKCAKCAAIFEIYNPAVSRKSTPSAVGEATFQSASKQKDREPPAPAYPAAAPAPAAKQVPASLAMPVGKRLSLAIIDGPGAGSVFRIEKPRVTIGRSGADLNIEDTEASRQHAVVEVRDTSYTVSDLGSKNGTLVEGTKIGGPTELTDKGEFQIGSSVIMLIVTDDV